LYPFCISGRNHCFIVKGYYFNVSAGVGFVSIFGISVMAGVILVSAFNRNGNLDEISLVSTQQMRSLLSVLIVAILGLIPAATSSGIGSDVQRPLATVIIGGLTSTLIFAPLLIPSLYRWVKQKSE